MTAPRPFADLTPAGRHARLRLVAGAALEAHGLAGAPLRFVADSFNSIFRAEPPDGPPVAVRVGPHLRIHPAGTEQVEARWMNELRTATDLPIPAVHPDRAGRVVTEIELPGVPRRRECVMFDWVAGRPLRRTPQVTSMAEAGRLLARLHDAAVAEQRTTVPEGVMVADRVLLFDDDDRLGECRARNGSLFDEARVRAQDVIDRLWADRPHPPHLLHGDLTWNNLLVGRGGLMTIIDFQDLMWGFEVQDVVNAVQPLDLATEGPRLGTAFRAGYCSVRPWPADDPDLFAALAIARRLVQVNLGLNVRKRGLEEHVERHAAAIRAWMADGPRTEIATRFEGS